MEVRMLQPPDAPPAPVLDLTLPPGELPTTNSSPAVCVPSPAAVDANSSANSNEKPRVVYRRPKRSKP